MCFTKDKEQYSCWFLW